MCSQRCFFIKSSTNNKQQPPPPPPPPFKGEVAIGCFGFFPRLQWETRKANTFAQRANIHHSQIISTNKATNTFTTQSMSPTSVTTLTCTNYDRQKGHSHTDVGERRPHSNSLQVSEASQVRTHQANANFCISTVVVVIKHQTQQTVDRDMTVSMVVQCQHTLCIQNGTLVNNNQQNQHRNKHNRRHETKGFTCDKPALAVAVGWVHET